MTDTGLLHFNSGSAGIAVFGRSPGSQVVTTCHDALFVEGKSPTP